MEEMNEETVIAEGYRRPTILGSNMLFAAVLFAMLIFSGIAVVFFGLEEAGTVVFFIQLTVLTVLAIGLPTWIYLNKTGLDFKFIMRLNKVENSELLLVAALALLAYPVVIAATLLWQWLLAFIGPPVPVPMPAITTFAEYLLAVIAIGVFPSVFEELLFRGVMLRGYERLGNKTALAITGVLFAFLHLSLVNLPGIVVLGLLMGYVVQRSDSIYTGMVYHFVHNTIAVTLLYFANTMQQYMQNGDLTTAQQLPQEQMMLAGMVFWAVVAVFSAIGFLACMKAYKLRTRNRCSAASDAAIDRPKRLFAEMRPILIAGVVIIFMLASEVMAMIAAR